MTNEQSFFGQFTGRFQAKLRGTETMGRRPKAQTPAPTGLRLKAQGCRAQRGYPGSTRRGINYPNGVAAARVGSHNPVGVVSPAVCVPRVGPRRANPGL